MILRRIAASFCVAFLFACGGGGAASPKVAEAGAVSPRPLAPSTTAAWEAADCEQSFSPDTTGRLPPTCSAWRPVPAGEVPAVERAAAAGAEVTCAKQKALCDDLGLKAESP